MPRVKIPSFNRLPVLRTSKAFVFGGAYGNFQATKAMLSKAEELGFTNDQIVFTGDSVAYCGQPEETANLLIEAQIHALLGNCEEALATGSKDCGCGFEEGTTCDLLSAQWYNFCDENISCKTKGWMKSLPRHIILELGKSRLLCTHATPDSINRFVFQSDFENGNYYMPNDDFDGYITGHSGLPFISEEHGKCWINSGAAGMPANDGTPRVWYATIEVSEQTINIEISPLEYDYAAAAEIMQDFGLNNGYRDCLSSGIWPSHDVLPKHERKMTGITLKLESRAFCNRDAEKTDEKRIAGCLTAI